LKKRTAKVTQKKKCPRRQKLNCNILAYLELEYLKDQIFTTERVSKLAKTLSLPRIKVYKWSWDRCKKTRLSQLCMITSDKKQLKKMAAKALEQIDQPSLLAQHFE